MASSSVSILLIRWHYNVINMMPPYVGIITTSRQLRSTLKLPSGGFNVRMWDLPCDKHCFLSTNCTGRQKHRWKVAMIVPVKFNLEMNCLAHLFIASSTKDDSLSRLFSHGWLANILWTSSLSSGKTFSSCFSMYSETLGVRTGGPLR